MIKKKNILATFFILLTVFSCSNKNSRLYNQGLQSYNKEDYQKAIILFTKDIINNGKSDLAYYNRARAEQKLGKYKKAIKDFDNAIEINKDLSSAHVNRAVSLVKLKKYNKALEGLNSMIEYFTIGQDSIINQNIAVAYNNRGLIKQLKQSSTLSALSDFNKSISIGNYNELYLSFMNRGKLYLKEKEYKKGLKDLDSSIVLNDTYSPTYYIRGRGYFEIGHLEPALSDLNSAIKLENNKWTYYNERGLIFNKLEKYNKSILDFNKAIEFSNHPYAYNNRGFAKYKLGFLIEGLKDCEKSLELNDKNGWVYYNLGLINYALGNTEKACLNFIKAQNLEIEEAIIEVKRKCLQ